MVLINPEYGLIKYTISLGGVFKYIGTWIGDEYRLMCITYYTQTNRKEGYRNPLTYTIIFVLSPSPSPPTTFNHRAQ